MPDFVTFDNPEYTQDTLEYSDVEEVTLGFAQNGVMLSFWGRFDGDYQQFRMVFPSLVVAFDMIKELEKCQAKK